MGVGGHVRWGMASRNISFVFFLLLLFLLFCFGPLHL